MLPLRDSNPIRRVPYVTILLIAVNAAVFLFWEPTFASGPRAEAQQEIFFLCHAEIPYEVTHQTALANAGPGGASAINQSFDVPSGSSVGAEVEQELARHCPDKNWAGSIFVAMFLHGGWIHIGGNMLFLWVFGNNIEDRLGAVRYLLFYLLGGLAAAALELATAASSAIPSLGASGAIAAVLGAYLVLYPRARVTTLVIFFVITVVQLPAIIVLGAWFVLQLFSGVGELGQHVNGGVAYFAHIGGFVFGALVALLFLRRRSGDPSLPFIGPPRPDLY
jgi:membrane associated rhomboid family serine protease